MTLLLLLLTVIMGGLLTHAVFSVFVNAWYWHTKSHSSSVDLIDWHRFKGIQTFTFSSWKSDKDSLHFLSLIISTHSQPQIISVTHVTLLSNRACQEQHRHLSATARGDVHWSKAVGSLPDFPGDSFNWCRTDSINQIKPCP